MLINIKKEKEHPSLPFLCTYSRISSLLCMDTVLILIT